MIAAVENPDVPLIASPYDLRVSLAEKLADSDVTEAVESGDWGFMHSFTTGSAVDGPGVRLVGWVTSCQFRCVFCHNPDTWKLKNGIPVPLARAVDVIKQYRHALQAMKGGLTISGGEPLLQQRFVLRLFAAARELGVHTALDTNGYYGNRLTDSELGLVDLVMLGVKAFSPDLHKQITGMDNAPVQAFARRLSVRKHPMWIRFVLVPGWSDNMDEIRRLADFAAGLGNVQRIDVLPFHQMGKYKWDKVGMDYKVRDTKPPSREQVDQVIQCFQAAGLNVV